MEKRRFTDEMLKKAKKVNCETLSDEALEKITGGGCLYADTEWYQNEDNWYRGSWPEWPCTKCGCPDFYCIDNKYVSIRKCRKCGCDEDTIYYILP